MTRNQKQGYRTAAYIAGEIIAREDAIHPEYEALKSQDDFVASAVMEILILFSEMNKESVKGNLRVCGI